MKNILLLMTTLFELPVFLLVLFIVTCMLIIALLLVGLTLAGFLNENPFKMIDTIKIRHHENR